MKLRNLSIFEFNNFAYNHPLGSYHQTSNYALLASENGYDYDILGYVDEYNNIHAAALILSKKIGKYRYGYSPKGFLIDFYNTELVTSFTTAIKKYYHKKGFVFIKINPEISVGSINYKNKNIIYNPNKEIENTLIRLKYRKLIDNKRFETKIPRFNAIQILKNTNLKTISKHTRNKVHRSINNGMSLIKGKREDIEILYKFIQKKKNNSINHYYNYYNAFNKDNKIDIFLVKINFEDCLVNCRKKYEQENTRNAILIEKVMKKPSSENLKRKLASDKALNIYNENITLATKYLSQNKTAFIAGAITIKYKNRVNILISGFDQEFKKLCPNYFLHYKLIEYYKKDYDFMDLNGITGDFSNINPYKGLDEFKKGFKPLAFEYIGEFDLLINESAYKNMDQKGLLAQEFNKKEKVLITHQ